MRANCSQVLGRVVRTSRDTGRGESDERTCRKKTWDASERDHGEISFRVSVLKIILSLGEILARRSDWRCG